MKNSIIKKRMALAAILILVTIHFPLSATIINGINYTFSSTNNTATVTSMNPGYSGDVVIPETVRYNNQTYQVTSIAESAFYGDTELTSVVIGNSVKTIGKQAFRECTNMTSIFLGSSVTTIAEWAFYKCTGLTKVEYTDIAHACRINYQYDSFSNPLQYAHHLYINGEEVKSLKIPDSVTSVGTRAFYGCSELTSVEFSSSVLSIEAQAFYGCTGLQELVIPNTIESIRNTAFSGCSGLKNVTIADGDKNLYLYANTFSPVRMETLYLGRNITYPATDTANQPFRGNKSIKELIIGPQVTMISEKAFSECSALETVTVADSERRLELDWFCFDGSPLKTLYIGRDIARDESYPVGINAFSNSTTLKNITFGDKVTSIYGSLFMSCTALNSITIPSSINSIGTSAFAGCKGLQEVIFEDSENLINLGALCFTNAGIETLYLGRDFKSNYISSPSDADYPFTERTKLQKLELGAPVKSIEDRAFAGCPLTEILTHAEDAPTIGFHTFSDAVKINCRVSQPESALSSYQKNWYMFECFRTGISADNTIFVSEAGELENLLPIDKSSEYIALKLTGEINGSDLAALNRCQNLAELDLSEATIVSGGNAYYESGSTRLYTSDNTLGDKWGYNLTRLTWLKLPQTLTTISSKAFQDKAQLYAISIPASVASIGTQAFDGCTALSDLTLEDSPTELTFGITVFKNAPIKRVYMGRNFRCSSSYYSDQPFYDIRSSKYVYSLTDLTIGNYVTAIGPNAFYDCRELKSVNIPDSVTSIGESAFCMCQGMSELTIGNSVTRIGAYAFCNCESLTTIVIPDPVEEIGESAFTGCDALQSLTLPGSLRKISGNAFRGDRSLQSLTIINPIPPTIESTTFEYIYNVVLTVPEGSRGAYYKAPYWTKFVKTMLEADNTDAETFAHGGVSYRVTSEVGNTVEVTASTLVSRSVELEIPAEVTIDDKTYKVTGIANNGLKNLPVTSVSLPQSVGYVGLEAFAGCGNLRYIESNALVPPSVDANSFDAETYSQCELSVPEETKDAYKTNSVWNQFRFNGDPIAISSIELDPYVLEAIEGKEYQITPNIYPADATNKDLLWTSSNEEIATVDQTGHVTVISSGTCTITAAATDGSDAKATCLVTVITGINESISDGNDNVSIITISGNILFQDAPEDTLDSLSPGIYIVRQGNTVKKIAVQ